MTLPNNFANVNRKVFTFFQETESNRSQIEIQKNEQNLFETEVDKSIPSQMAMSRITDLSFDWLNFQVTPLGTAFDGSIKEVFQNWEITIEGLRFEQLSALKHNLIFRFGTGEPLLDFEIQEDTTVRFVKNILSNNIENESTNIYTFYYGIYLFDSAGLEEINQNGLQVKLQLSLFNPNYYS